MVVVEAEPLPDVADPDANVHESLSICPPLVVCVAAVVPPLWFELPKEIRPPVIASKPYTDAIPLLVFICMWAPLNDLKPMLQLTILISLQYMKPPP